MMHCQSAFALGRFWAWRSFFVCGGLRDRACGVGSGFSGAFVAGYCKDGDVEAKYSAYKETSAKVHEGWQRFCVLFHHSVCDVACYFCPLNCTTHTLHTNTDSYILKHTQPCALVFKCSLITENSYGMGSLHRTWQNIPQMSVLHPVPDSAALTLIEVSADPWETQQRLLMFWLLKKDFNFNDYFSDTIFQFPFPIT